MTRDEILERLRKMKALADHGVGGERENAELLLAEIAAKHGIDLDELEEERRKDFYVELRESFKHKILSQLCALKRQELKRKGASLEGHRMSVWKCKGNYMYSVSNCTEAEWLELMAKLEVLRRDYKRQEENFYYAFLMANDLLVEPKDDAEESSDEERRNYFLAAQMSLGIEKSRLNKQLTLG